MGKVEWKSIDEAPEMQVLLVHHEYYSHGRVRMAYLRRGAWIGVNADGSEGKLLFEPTGWVFLPDDQNAVFWSRDHG